MPMMVRSRRYTRSLEEGGKPESHAILTPQEARQGVVSGRVLTVLAISLALAVIAGAVLLAIYMYALLTA